MCGELVHRRLQSPVPCGIVNLSKSECVIFCRLRVIRSTNISYEQTASAYAVHRHTHGGVSCVLYKRDGLGPGARVLEVGCGTGNYIRTLSERQGWDAYGLDPSAAMLARARTEPEPVSLILGRAEQMAFAADTFDLVFSVDVIHHIADKVAFYAGVAQGLRPGGQVCTVTDSADIIRSREVLSGYFPETVDRELARYPRISQLEAWMAAVGFVDMEVVDVEEVYDVTSAQPFRDKVYSSLHLISGEAWQAGLERLERDLARGPIQGTSRYACVWGRKR